VPVGSAYPVERAAVHAFQGLRSLGGAHQRDGGHCLLRSPRDARGGTDEASGRWREQPDTNPEVRRVEVGSDCLCHLHVRLDGFAERRDGGAGRDGESPLHHDPGSES